MKLSIEDFGLPGEKQDQEQYNSQRLERDAHWKKFKAEFFPATILDIFPRDALQDLVRGFFLKIRRGVSIVYGHRDVNGRWNFDNPGRIDPYDTEEGLNANLLNPICFELRHSGKAQDLCIKCDKDHAAYCASEAGPVRTSYSCWLGLKDISYPVRVANEIIAVALAGQIPPDASAELDEIKTKLRTFGGAKADELIRSLEIQVEQRVNSGLTSESVVAETYEDLRVFVVALEKLMAALYASAQREAVGDLLDYWESSLPTVDRTYEQLWWRRVAELAEGFLGQFEMGRVSLLVRAGKYFYRQWPRDESCNADARVRVAARDVLQAVQPDNLVPVDNELTRSIATKILPSGGISYFYRTRTASADAHSGLLFAVEGAPARQFKELGEQFLRRISARAEYASLTFQIKRMHEQYMQTVSDAAHDFRRPLQYFEYVFADLVSEPSISQHQTLVEELEKMRLRLLQIEEQALSLQKAEKRAKKEPRQVLNLVELMGEVIELMAPRASAHPCRITRDGSWPKFVMIKASRVEMFRVFLNLIDNAIKYSFMGDQFEVRVQVLPVDWVTTDEVKVVIRNFGIGILPDHLERIRERGTRGGVRDDRLQREGTGIGLSIVSRFLHDHEGTFDIESTPEMSLQGYKKTGRESDEKALGHRYVTTVTVRLKPYRNS